VAGKVLSDRVTFNRVAARAEEAVTDTLRTASAQVHYQGVAVPLLAARGDIAGLASVAENAALPEETRLGAVEGLAAAAREDAEEELVKIGKAEGQPEGLRKAAWRGRRRSKRARLRAVRAAAGAVGVVGAAAKEEAK
jgi:ParB family chromosome partitioning protein